MLPLQQAQELRAAISEYLKATFTFREQKVHDAFHSFINHPKDGMFNGCKYPKFFYRLRNSIVHFRAKHKKYSMSDAEWKKIIHLTLDIIQYHYDKNRMLLDSR